MKKQIVFIEPKLAGSTFKMARALKLKGGYENILVTFIKPNKQLAEKAFDKVYVLEIDFVPSIKNIFKIARKLTEGRTYSFLKSILKLKPYVVQIRGASIETPFLLWLFKKSPRVYYLQDIWQYYKKRFSLKKNSGVMQYFNGLICDICCRHTDSILNRSGENSLEPLKDKIKVPVLDFLPYCLDEWIVAPKKKSIGRNKDIHVVYAGTVWYIWERHKSFPELINKITTGGIHLHVYPSNNLREEIKRNLRKIEENNKFFHLHERKSEYDINKEIARYDYGICIDFVENSENLLWTKTAMSAKMFGYIEAGLPMTIDRGIENMHKIIEENKIGFGINYDELGKLKEIFSKRRYPSLKNLREAQENLKISKKIRLLDDFYTKIHNLKVRK